MVVVSAPGKLHLIGEHSVVYNEPAIIAAVGLRTTVKVEKASNVRYYDTRFDHDFSWPLDEVRKAKEDVKRIWQQCFEKKNFTELFTLIKADKYKIYKQAIVGLALEHLGIDGGVSLEIRSDIPVGAGMGSSASLHVCLAKGIADAYGKHISLDEVNNVAFELEKIIHGTPSGGDNSTSCFGGLIWFQKGTPNTIKPLKDEIPHKLENFVAVHTKQPEKTTGELVQLVRDLPEEFRTKRVKEIGAMARELLAVLKRKDTKRMQEIMNKTQENLAELGVSIPEIDKIATAVREIGGAAKLCGAGGGGFMLCHHDDVELLKDVILSLGYKPLEIELAVDGVNVQ